MSIVMFILFYYNKNSNIGLFSSYKAGLITALCKWRKAGCGPASLKILKLCS